MIVTGGKGGVVSFWAIVNSDRVSCRLQPRGNSIPNHPCPTPLSLNFFEIFFIVDLLEVVTIIGLNFEFVSIAHARVT